MIELHLHLDGSLRPKTVWELAKTQGIKLPAESLEETEYRMTAPKNCRTLNEYLKRFDLPLLVLQEEEAVELAVYQLTEDLAGLGVEYGEIRFAPQLSTKKGLSQAQVVEAAMRGARRGMKDFPSIRIGLILCCMRGKDLLSENLETVEMTSRYLNDVVCGVDLAGAEALYPTSMFEEVFRRAGELSLPMTIHAGEAAGPESIWAALACRTKRIGHGVAAVKDPELMKRLAEEKITLEVCVTSNCDTKVVEDVKDHPIRTLFDAGVRVTVNSDNMTVSNTNIQQEEALLKRVWGFTEAELETMRQYAREAAFLK